MGKHMIIAIDGPAGAGKTTIAKLLAKKEGYTYVDTGAMYRAIGLYIKRNGVNIENEEELKKACKDIHIGICYENGEQKVYLNDENVSGLIRTEEIGNLASACSAHASVREKLLDLQRSFADQADIVMEGRDIGTNVFPDAQLKIYLTASAETRAERRMKDLKEKGENPVYEEVLIKITERDYRDINRKIAPLKIAEDAIVLDSSNMTRENVMNTISEYNKTIKKM